MEKRTKEATTLGNVFDLRRYAPLKRGQPPPTDDELAEYRRVWPQVLRMLNEWGDIKCGCPIAGRLTAPPLAIDR
jgi:hypothetical protein